jgi:ligand-binding SRPBCC domain-containing protein
MATEIDAPSDRCFLLSLSIDLHVASTVSTGERAVAGVTHGIIGLGETVTWRGRHFGVTLQHETLITKCDHPRYFQDVMVRGAFHSFIHDHYFEPTESARTLMRDELRFAAPLGPLGWVAEKAVLCSYLRRFLAERNQVIRETAEGAPAIWQHYLAESA